jgi:hypothetical protein
MNRACPKCRSMEVRRSRRRSVFDRFLGLMGFMPYRCLACYQRFHAFRLRIMVRIRLSRSAANDLA